MKSRTFVFTCVLCADPYKYQPPLNSYLITHCFPMRNHFCLIKHFILDVVSFRLRKNHHLFIFPANIFYTHASNTRNEMSIYDNVIYILYAIFMLLHNVCIIKIINILITDPKKKRIEADDKIKN